MVDVIPGPHTWPEAMALQKAFNAAGGFAGHTDRRLPDIEPLLALSKKTTGPAPNFPVNVFTAMAETFDELDFDDLNFWSSTLDKRRYYARGVAFAFGRNNYWPHTERMQVRLVRET
jgi:hypothetical protein